MRTILLIASIVAFASIGNVAKAAVMPKQDPKGKAAIVDIARVLGLPKAWADWLVWVAMGESGWSLTAHNKSSGEKAAAGRAFDRLVADGRWPCERQRSVYAIGSGGWYGQLAPYTSLFAARLDMPNACNPKAIWQSPLEGTLVHLEQVKGTISAYLNRLPAAKRTFLHLRALYGLPNRIHKPDEIDNPNRRAQYSKTLRRAGIDPSFLDKRVPPLE